MTKKTVTFGEIMLRLAPPNHQRFEQAQALEVVYGGGEANVAITLARFGLPIDYVTRLPRNALGMACAQYLRQYGIGTDHILFGGERLGIYFLEVGAMQRASRVIYDRDHSALASVEPGMFDWEIIFADADWFHWTGITPAINAQTAEVCMEAVEAAARMGLTISCDLNHRNTLWQWGKTPDEIMPAMLAKTHIVMGNEITCRAMLNVEVSAATSNGNRAVEDHQQLVCEALVEAFPNLRSVALTVRKPISTDHNTLTGVLWETGNFFVTRTFDLTHIVDRVGGGDAFTGGIIYGLRTHPEDPQHSLDFAVAAASLKHSFHGDANLSTVEEVESLLAGNPLGQVIR